jgi:hypothetical protein
MQPADERTRAHSYVKVVVGEKATLENLHAALDQAIRQFVPKGGCQCGLTGFDLTFLGGDPALAQLTQIPNIQGGLVTHGQILDRAI